MQQMFRNIIITVSLIVLAMILIGCAPAVTPAASSTSPAVVPSASQTPSSTQSEAPSTSTSTTQVSKPNADVIETSFTSVTYANDEYGFSIKHPVKWKKEAVKVPTIYSARAVEQVPNLSIVAVNIDTAEQEIEQLLKDSKLSNIKYVEKKDFVLRDGATKAQYVVYKSDYPGAKLISYGVGLVKGTKYISFSIVTIDGLEDPETFNEVFNTITFNK
jgi:hypothetical protein